MDTGARTDYDESVFCNPLSPKILSIKLANKDSMRLKLGLGTGKHAQR